MTSRPASRQPVSPLPRQVNTQTRVLDTHHGRILCIADIRGRLSGLNDLAREANATAIIHTGDFGFFESTSLDRINDRTLRHLTQYSPLIPSAQRTHLLSDSNGPSVIRSTVNIELLSEFPLLLSGQLKLQVPVFTVWGACEDVFVLEKFRSGAYSIENLTILDEATTRCLDVGGVKLRLFGLGGALVSHKLFDNGEGNATIAGGQGTMWTTALQIGELVDTAQRVFDATETRLLVTHAAPGREGIISQLALVLKADLTVSAGLHFRYASSYNEFSVQSDFEGLRHKLTLGKDSFDKVWESVKLQVDAVIDDNQRVLLDKALSVVQRIPPVSQPNGAGPVVEEPAWKNCWNWNLCDAAYGSLILDLKEGRVSSELKSQGFNYAYRRTATAAATPISASAPLPAQAPPSSGPTKVSTPVPEKQSQAAQKSATATPPPPDTAKDSPKLNGTADKKKPIKKKGDKTDGTNTPDAPTSSTPIPDAEREGSDGVKSPFDASSTGARTPKSNRPPRHPWTIFMRMPPAFQVTEAEIRDFYQDSKQGITKVNFPNAVGNKPRLAYVEFGDEEAMKAGLEKHAEKLKDIVPEVKQATDRESRGEGSFPRGGFRGRGGRGGGAFAARGLSSAGLTRRGNGDAPHNGPDAPIA